MPEHDRSRAGGLPTHHPRAGVRLPGIQIFTEPTPVGRDVPRVADRQEMEVRRITQRIADLEGRRLLTLDPHRVDGIHHLDQPRLAQLAHDPQGIVEIAADGHRRRPVHQRLSQLAQRDLTLRQQDDALQPGTGRIRRGRGRCVPRRGTHHRLRSTLQGLRDGHGHSPVLERAGRVQGLVLQVQFKPPANGADKSGRRHQRRVAFQQRHHRRRRRDRKEIGVAPDHSGPRIGRFRNQVHRLNGCSTPEDLPNWNGRRLGNPGPEDKP